MQESKTERIDIRTTSSAKALLQQAASSLQKSVSEFLLENGLNAASEALADRTLFTLNETDWQAFQTALDHPPRSRPRLKSLLNDPGIFDE